MEKLKMHSLDMVEQNIEKLASLFPNCVTEYKGVDGKLQLALDFDLLKQELSRNIVEGPQERYQLNWPGKREALLTANAPIAKTLRPCREESVDFDITQNLFIEGDNLDALKLLQETYLGKVKMIYIDPPYNTGNDFVYKDNFTESTTSYLVRSNQIDEEGNQLVANTFANGRFHSDWLSMIYPRLKLARNLLADDGLIFISIDSHEVHNLRKLCDEIFGEGSHKNTIAVRRGIKNVQAQFDDLSSLSQGHEYVLLYAKTSDVRLPKLSLAHEDKKPGKWDTFWRGTDRPTMRYELLGVHPESGQWRWEKSRSLEAVDNYKKYLAQAESGLSLDDYFLDHLTSTNIKLNFVRKSEEGTIQYYVPPSEGKLLSDNWMDITLSGNETQEFDTEKSVHLLQRIVEWACDKNGIVLDFFAGSGTTAHATMAINAKDEGERKFILVQLPEQCSENSAASKAGYKTIADITKDRIRRAGESFVSEKTPDVGFRVLKIDTSNMSDICYIPDALTQGELFEQVENVKSDRNEEDLLFQVMLDWGVELTLPIRREVIDSKTVFFVDTQSDNTQGALVACFDKTGGINEVFIKQLATFNPLRLVFRDAGFSSDATKINVEQLLKQLSPTTDVKTI
ncbi:site-specific DNA-methyltransferase [Yersinia kristensenii]|uniref:site-specific DNA-methyltransferase n=1 Tax=Yersinia kristensenii TaxID=28152 RepID=UPI00119FFE71|nr:site-specific DNA-methyltransferase [Yersinia kristensenii]